MSRDNPTSPAVITDNNGKELIVAAYYTTVEGSGTQQDTNQTPVVAVDTDGHLRWNKAVQPAGPRTQAVAVGELHDRRGVSVVVNSGGGTVALDAISGELWWTANNVTPQGVDGGKVPDDDPPWLYWLGPAAIAVNAGSCLLLLGQAQQAAAMLHEGVAQLSESFIRERQLHLTQLAEARARPGKQRDLDAAAGLGMQSIDLAESLDSTRGAGRLRDLYVRMQPYGKIPAVRDFLERARGFAEG